MALIDNWKQVGKDFKEIGTGSVKDIGKGIGKTAKDFGKTMYKSVKHTAKKVNDWASSENDDEVAEAQELAEETEKEEN